MPRSLLPTLLFLVAPLTTSAAELPKTVTFRGNLENSLHQFAKNGRGHVAFIGGSITEMNGYRPMVADWLTKRFPKTKFTFTNAGISSTCSTTGAFRLYTDVIHERPGVPEGGVDLLFVEFAVNDDQDAGHSKQNAIRGLEGLIRRARKECPRADVVVTYFVNPGMLELLRKGKTPVSVAAHEEVAKQYGVSTVHLAQEVANRVDDGSLTWAVYGGTHPRPAGNRIAADLNVALLETAWAKAAKSESSPEPHDMPERLIATCYDDGSWNPGYLGIGEGWEFETPDWKTIPGSLRERFAGKKMGVTTTPGATTKTKFRGRGIGAYVLAGPDAGTLEARIDGGEWKSVDLYHRFSKGLHYPRTVMFFNDLNPGEHVLETRLTDKNSPRGLGPAVRVVNWVVNGDG